MTKFSREERVILVVLLLLMLVLVALGVSAFREYRIVRPVQHGLSRAQWIAALEGNRPAAATQTDAIRAWMTFEYLNRIFDLSPDMLKTGLSITDKRYPKITIATYAANAGLSAAEGVARIAALIDAFHTSSTP